jgi:AcrR family transcriptional regulator
VGIEKLSLRGIARSVGVSQTAPYRHFKDKTELLAEIATQAFLA